MKYLLRRCLGWVWRVQVPSKKVLGSLGVDVDGLWDLVFRWSDQYSVFA